MFFMIGIFPGSRILTTMFLQCPSCQRMEQAEILETGSRLVIFFLPVWTFSRQYFVRFSGCQSVYQIVGMDREQILQASRQDLEAHLQCVQAGKQTRCCPFCGYELQEDFRYCPRCGSDLNPR